MTKAPLVSETNVVSPLDLVITSKLFNIQLQIHIMCRDD
jgi:hypothetical protein